MKTFKEENKSHERESQKVTGICHGVEQHFINA